MSKITLNINKLDIHTLEVMTKSITSLFVKVGGVLIGMLVSIALGRILGPDGYGIINLAERVINILIIVCLLGVRQLIVKNIAIAKEHEDFQSIGNIMHSAYILNGVVTLLLSSIFIIISPWLSNDVFHEPRLTIPLMIFLVGLTPQVMSRLLSSGLIGYRKIWQSNLVEQTLSIAITGLFLFLLYFIGLEITVNIVAVIYVIGRIGVTITVSMYWSSLFTFKSKWERKSITLFRDSLPLFLSSVSTIIISNSDVIILGIFASTSDIGLYGIAIKIALLTSFFLQITNSSVGPKIAALYFNGSIMETEQMVKKVTRVLLICGLVSIVIFIFFGNLILSLWGDEFQAAYIILLILSFGQLFNIGTGAAGQILTMTGHEKFNRNITVFYMILNILLNYIFIKKFGILGAAFINSFTVISLNVTRVIYAKKLTGISTI
nr:flippase [Algoriphagus machipongonensis]